MKFFAKIGRNILTEISMRKLEKHYRQVEPCRVPIAKQNRARRREVILGRLCTRRFWKR